MLLMLLLLLLLVMLLLLMILIELGCYLVGEIQDVRRQSVGHRPPRTIVRVPPLTQRSFS